MANSLNSLVIQSIDTFTKICGLHDLLEIALDQEEFRADGKRSKSILLVQTYLWSVESELEEMQATLEELKQKIHETRLQIPKQ